MKIKIKRIDKSLPLPKYETKGAVAFDLYSRVDMEIAPQKIALIPTNIVVETPEDYMLTVVPRSSAPKKKGIIIPHGIGIIDQDYCGPEDEVKLQVLNYTDETVKVARGERVGQAVFVRIDKFEWQEVDEMNNKTRGGFGSTDKNEN